MLIRVNDEIINVDAITHARFTGGVSTLGMGGPVRNTQTLTISFSGGAEIALGDDVAEQVWKLLCGMTETIIGPQEPK